MLWLFSDQVKRASGPIDFDRLRAVISSHYLGSRALDSDIAAKAPRVNDALRAVGTHEPWITSVYDILSEVASSELGGYCTIVSRRRN